MIKKIIIKAILAMSLTSTGWFSAFAADVSVGITTWYADWVFKTESGEEVKFDPGFLYGPVLAVKLSDEFSLTGLFLYGKFKEEGGDEIARFDSDFALNYNFHSYFKVYGGIKYMGYGDSIKDMGYNSDSGGHMSVGPAAGLGVTYPLYGNLYLLLNLSALYALGTHTDDGSVQQKRDLREWGINTNCSFAYYIPSWAATLTLGGRYQYVKTEYTEGSGEDHYFHFYGITASVIKTF